MALRKVLIEGDPLLHKASREVLEITDRIRALVGDMWETMYAANGVGLAAPQVGVLRRVVVIDATKPEGDPEDEPTGLADPPPRAGGDAAPAPEIIKYVLINPEIIEVSEETVSAKEGCLSVPGMVGIVERPARVKVRALDMSGEPFEIEGEGLLAKALSHEIDHLDGILYTDIAESVEEVNAE
ncbi:MAG: peptide deformylase [Clostridiales Family XIII bacterium]|jgi:peptide deformylase|nr:peptide deformylase [Clostridiales Family XIII bacterium]